MIEHFIEISPFQKPDADGYCKGIIHTSKNCSLAVSYCFPAYDDRHPTYYKFKIGRGAWIRVKKNDLKCPDCFK